MFLASVHVAHVCVDGARVLFGITHRHFHTHSSHVGLMLVALTSDMMVKHTHMQDLLFTGLLGLPHRKRYMAGGTHETVNIIEWRTDTCTRRQDESVLILVIVIHLSRSQAQHLTKICREVPSSEHN